MKKQLLFSVFSVRLEKKAAPFEILVKIYTVSLPLNQHCFFIVLGSLFFAD